jgi:hypothetical protein
MQTALRAVSAREALTPLAVLVPILATVAGSFWALTVFPPLIVLIVAVGLTLTALAGKRSCGSRHALAVAGFTLIAAVGAVFLVLWFFVSSSTCGKVVDGAWQWLPFTVGALVYFALGIYGFRTDRATAIVPMALIGGVIATLVLLTLVPGTPGFCD